MIPKECKRLAEVDFPIAVVSKHAVREKSIRHGHPSTLHLWWARRPLASCRAMLLALLLPDPCDEHCPEEFKDEARKLLPPVVGPVGPKDEDLRAKLLKFIGDFANWDLNADRTWISAARGLVSAAHPDDPPLVVDPFAGGGAIPLEALRVGCDAFASDLNPVACLIEKVMLEDIPRHGPELADELRRAGREIKDVAKKELAKFYPGDPDGARPIAYLWGRTVRCEAPNCGAEIQLIRSFWLCKKSNRKRALKYSVVRSDTKTPRVIFEIFEPTVDSQVPRGTVTLAKATCCCCGTVMPPERVRAQLSAQHGGADVVFDAQGRRAGGARMLAVVTLRMGVPGRHYRLPTDRDYEAVRSAQEQISALLDDWEQSDKSGLCPIPNESLPPIGTLGFRIQRYGMVEWRHLFTARQALGIRSIASATRQCVAESNSCSALAVGKLIDLSNAICAWIPQVECPSAVFKLGRVKMGWDFVEGALLGESSGSYSVCVDNMIAGVLSSITYSRHGEVSQAQAQRSALPDESASVWFTDPPYYDAIPYSDLADFFLVWLKRTLPNHPLLRDPFDSTNPLSPKDQEIVQDDTRTVDGKFKDKEFFESSMAAAFAEGRRVLSSEGIGCVVFAHKTTEGWEALLTGMIRGG